MTSLIEKLQALHFWPQFVADTHGDIVSPRQAQGLYDVGNVAIEAAYAMQELLDALKECQAILSRLTGPEGDKDDIQHTWAACVAAELKARKTIKKATQLPNQLAVQSVERPVPIS